METRCFQRSASYRLKREKTKSNYQIPQNIIEKEVEYVMKKRSKEGHRGVMIIFVAYTAIPACIFCCRKGK
jgi:hypothetical protein